MTKTVLITGIGGNVGQGILRNIISLERGIRLIGTNTLPISAGNHLCDVVYKVPFSSDHNYISAIKKICKKEKVDLIIPSTDYEVYYLGLQSSSLPALASIEIKIAEIFLDKFKTSIAFEKAKIPFAKTIEIRAYKNEFEEIIVKPRAGRGSRGVSINPKTIEGFADHFIVQKLYRGIEITTAFYVNKSGKLHGFITFERLLSGGATNQCEVVTKYDTQIKKIIMQMIKAFSIRGSCNFQAIVTDSGEIVLFEVNGRISGTNSVRSQLGFEDVKYTIQEYLYGETPSVPVIKKGSCVRILMDVIYPDVSLKKIKNNKTKHFIF